MPFDQGYWRPNKKQAEFLALPWSIKEGFYGGGAGSGKSDVLLVYGLIHKLHENPLFKQVFMRRTYKDLKKEIVGRSREIYSKFGATFNATDMVWTFPRPDQFGSGRTNAGAQIFLGHCEHEKNVHDYDSMEISLYTPDELTNYTEYIYLYIGFERNRAPRGSGLPSIIRGAGMPGGIGHTFVKKRFVDPYPEGGKIVVGRGGNKRIYIHATLEDNKDNIDPTYSQSLDGRPEAERKAKKFGDWSAYLGQVFDEFRDKRYHDEPENALHVVPPFEIPEWWPKFLIGDWGFRALCYNSFWAVSPAGRAYLYRELGYLGKKISVWAPEVRYFVEKENPRIIKYCQSAGQDRGLDHTIQSQIEEELGRPVELSVNARGTRLAGKALVHEFLRWKPKPRPPIEELPPYDEAYAQWVYRNKGPQEYQNYIELYEPPPEETNLPKLQIFCCEEYSHEGHDNCCPLMIDAIKACTYDDDKEGKTAEDVKEFQGDDPYDTLRYACDTIDAYTREAVNEFERVQKQARLVETLKNTQDWTGFYRNMRTMESQASQIQVVKRYSRRRRYHA